MNNYSYVVKSPAAVSEFCEISPVDEDRVADLRAANLSARDALRLADIFAALSDPTRLRLLDALARIEEMCVCDLCALLDLRQSAVSHQLRLLRNLRLVKNRRAGRLVYYSLDDEHVRCLMSDGLDHVREEVRL